MRRNYMKNGEIREGDSLHFDGRGFYTGSGKSPKKRNWKYAIGFVIVLLIIAFLFSRFMVSAAPVDRNSPTGYDYTCPEGQVPIGGGACRITPTGCPFGDSVPMDKCTPPPDLKCNADWSHCEPRKTSDKDPTPPDPDRPYYDQYGNKYSYDGKLIKPAPKNACGK